MSWRVEMKSEEGGWKVVPPADYSLTRLEAVALAETYEESRIVSDMGEIVEVMPREAREVQEVVTGTAWGETERGEKYSSEMRRAAEITDRGELQWRALPSGDYYAVAPEGRYFTLRIPPRGREHAWFEVTLRRPDGTEAKRGYKSLELAKAGAQRGDFLEMPGRPPPRVYDASPPIPYSSELSFAQKRRKQLAQEQPPAVKKETFAAAKARLLREFAALGWATRPGLKFPRVTAPPPDDFINLWIKGQSVYGGVTSDMGDAHSLESDYRGVSAELLVRRMYGRIERGFYKGREVDGGNEAARLLAVGDNVIVEWTWGGSRFRAAGVVAKVSRKTVKVRLTEHAGEHFAPGFIVTAQAQNVYQRAEVSEVAGEAQGQARDYPDIEAALLGAQSKLDATHMLRTNGQIVIFSPTARGYIRRVMFRQGGHLHWPASGPTVPELPSGARMIWQAMPEIVSWTPEAPPEPALPVAAEQRDDRRRARKEHREFIERQERLSRESKFTVLQRNELTGTAHYVGFFQTYEEAEAYAKNQATRSRSFMSYEIWEGGPRHPRKRAPDSPSFRGEASEERDNPVEPTGSFAKMTRDPKAYSAAMARAKEIGPLTNARHVYDLLVGELAKEDQEVFLVLPLDVRGQLRSDPIEVHRGERSRVGVAVPDVMRAVIEAGGEGFVVCHNHPTTIAEPSEADKDLTKAIRKAAECIELAFVDHVVIGMGEYYSFADKKLHKVKGKKS